MLIKTIDFFKTLLIAAFLAFFCIRGFIAEPFKIPSSSMEPTLLIGDFLVVSKFAYGNRLPLTNFFFWQRNPQRGDIAVFKKKDDNLPGSFFGLGDTLFIKRIVGLPGDRIAYQNQTLFINGKPVTLTPSSLTLAPGDEESQAQEAVRLGGTIQRFTAHLPSSQDEGKVSHTIQYVAGSAGPQVAETTIPTDMFVVMGDNRDNSRDSRFWAAPSWGYVPRADLMGRAEFIFFSWAPNWALRLGRIGQGLHPAHQPQS